jgi:hypothetical protein
MKACDQRIALRTVVTNAICSELVARGLSRWSPDEDDVETTTAAGRYAGGMVPRFLIFLAIAPSLLGACGGDPAIPTLLVNDQCEYDGPERVVEGPSRLTLQRAGLGDYRAALVRLQDGHDASDLEEHFETVSHIWEDRPDWLVVRYVVEVDDSNVGRPHGDTVVMSVEPGDHGVVCITDERASVAANLEVTPAS